MLSTALTATDDLDALTEQETGFGASDLKRAVSNIQSAQSARASSETLEKQALEKLEDAKAQYDEALGRAALCCQEVDNLGL